MQVYLQQFLDSKRRHYSDKLKLGFSGKEQSERNDSDLKPGFQIVVPVAKIVPVASNFWRRQGRPYGNALAITQDDPCDRNDQSSEIDFESISDD